MKNKFRRRLVRFLLIPLAVLILLIGAAFVILLTQQDRLVKMAIKEVNKKLSGQILLDGSSISLFQNYPYISIRLNNVRLYASKQTTAKPLFQAERVFAGFSLPDVLKQKYRVKAIVLKNGHVDLVEEQNGQLNIVEASKITADTVTTADTSSTKLDLDIKKIVLKNMAVSFFDKQNGQLIATRIERIQSNVEYDSAKVVAGMTGKFAIDYSSPGSAVALKNKHIETEFSVNYGLQSQLLKILVGKLTLEDALFNITGSVDLAHNNTLDLKFAGDKPDLGQLFAFAPESVAKELKHFKYDGHVNFEGAVKGAIVKGKMPRIDLNFGCDNAWVHNKESDRKLDSIAFKGSYTNGAGQSNATSELKLENMHARPDKGIFDGTFIMRDFDHPKVFMQVNSKLQLEFIGAFLGIKDLQRITGEISLKMNFKDMVDLSTPEKSIIKLTQGVESELAVRNLTFRIPNFPHNVEHLNLHAGMHNGFVKLDSLACKIGGSDFYVDGSVSDLPATFHQKEKPVIFTLNTHSNKIILRELLNIDTAKTHKGKEEIYGFTLGISLETSVDQMLHPNPLPKGVLRLQHLNASFKRYPHAFKEFGAELTIADTMLRLKNFNGHIDSSDILFSGRVNNYALWFEKVKRGRTEIAFDFKSEHLAMKDLLARRSKQLVNKDYQDEVASHVWLRSKTMLKYDSIFRFANCKIANISGQLQKHKLELDSIKGNIKFGIDHFIKIDTLTGKIGRSDFDINMRLYTGKDSAKKAKENYLRFASRFLDVDQLTNYQLTPQQEADAKAAMNDTSSVATHASTVAHAPSAHAKAFNIFQVPFIDFNASVQIGKVKYKRLWIKHVDTKLRMLEAHHFYLDTLHMEMAGGAIDARAHFNGTNPDKIYLRTKIKANNIDLEKMMLKMDYLGQDYVINKNIKGHFTGQVKCYMQVHPDLTPMIEQMKAELDMNIYDGQLINFTPLSAMSSYFKDKNLKIIRFDTLKNVLTFENSTLNIPTMNINSSLGFIEIAGKQSLDMKMEYFMRIPLKMVTQVGFTMLFNKKKEEVDPDQIDAIEYRDKDRKVRFLNVTVSGTPEEFKVKMGKPKKA